jgi:hypothetical protein
MYVPRQLLCGNSAHEMMMQYLSDHAPFKASLPVSRQGRRSACAHHASTINAQPKLNKTAK